MKQFIGTQTLMSEFMTLGAYNELRGWTIPVDEDPLAGGYYCEYPDGHRTWIPQDKFEAVYRADGEFNFGHACFLLERGACVRRAGWNGKGMFLFKVAASVNLTVNREPLLSILGEGATFTYQSHYDMKTADGSIVPWLCSQSDMQANDWQIVPE